MGIDIMYAKEEDGQWVQDGEETERVASAGQFFNLSSMLSNLLDLIKDIEDPNLIEQMKPFWRFVEEDREGKIERFNYHCNFINDARQQMLEQAGEGAQMVAGPTDDIAPDTFDATIRAFIGGLILTGDPIPPEIIGSVMPFIIVASGLMSAAAEQLQQQSPEVAQAMASAEENLRIVSEFGQKAIDESRYLYFDA